MCDAAAGSLSSYAYVLMLLHYLQTVTPPILPILQQVCTEISGITLALPCLNLQWSSYLCMDTEKKLSFIYVWRAISLCVCMRYPEGIAAKMHIYLASIMDTYYKQHCC